MRNGKIVLATAEMLRYKQPDRLVIDFPATMEVPQSLPVLLRAVTENLKENTVVDIKLHRSKINLEPCDEVLEELFGAR